MSKSISESAVGLELVRLNRSHIELGLAWKFQVNPDSCDNPEHYEEYIKFHAVRDCLDGRGTTHILVEDEKILGYITFKASCLTRRYDGSDLPEGDPALEIAELAISTEAENMGYASLLVQYSFVISGEINQNQLGIRYITLCADPKAVGFYEKHGFKRIEEWQEIPREGWNKNCIPMFIRVPDLPN